MRKNPSYAYIQRDDALQYYQSLFIKLLEYFYKLYEEKSSEEKESDPKYVAAVFKQ